jgi:sarcosine oxidase delta subunit
MVDFGFSEALTLAQTIGIVGTMVLTLYFSRRQIRSLAGDSESRVLNDLDEKLHRMGEMFIERPDLLKVISSSASGTTPEHAASYYVLFICAHAYHMRKRKVLSDNEWEGWMYWMKNAFQEGTIKGNWTQMEMGRWFDPHFRNFVNTEIIGMKQVKS